MQFIKCNKGAKIVSYLLIISVVLLVITIIFPKETQKTISKLESTGNIVSDQINNKKVDFIFKCNIDNFSHISFQFATYEKTVQGGIIGFSLYDNLSGKLLSETSTASENIIDNAYYTVEFDEQKQSKGKEYRITITANCSDPITLWANNENVDGVITTIDNEKVANLAHQIMISKNSYPYTLDILILIAVLITLLGVTPSDVRSAR